MGGLIQRGEVRFYQFREPDKMRPVLILTRNSIIDILNEVTIAPITSTIRNIPTEVLLSIEDGMKNDCAINLDHIQTISKDKIGSLVLTITAKKMEEVKQSLLFALGF